MPYKYTGGKSRSVKGKLPTKSKSASVRSYTPTAYTKKRKAAFTQARLVKAAAAKGAKLKTPGAKGTAANRLRAKMLVGQTQRVRKAPSLPRQAALVKSAMPKAKAQRSAAEINAMHAYRAKRRKKAAIATKRKTKMTRGLPYKADTSGPYR